MLIATQEDQKGDDDQHSQHKRDRAYRSGEPMHVVTQEVAPQPKERGPHDAPCGIEEQKAWPAHAVGPGQECGPGPQHGDKAPEEDEFAAMQNEELVRRPGVDGGHQQHGLTRKRDAGALNGHKDQDRPIPIGGEQMHQVRCCDMKHVSSAFSISDAHGANARHEVHLWNSMPREAAPLKVLEGELLPARLAMPSRLAFLVVGHTKRRALLLPSVRTIATADETEMRKELVSHRHLICLGYSKSSESVRSVQSSPFGRSAACVF